MNVWLNVVDCGGDRLNWLTVERNVTEAVDDHAVNQVDSLKEENSNLSKQL